MFSSESAWHILLMAVTSHQRQPRVHYTLSCCLSDCHIPHAIWRESGATLRLSVMFVDLGAQELVADPVCVSGSRRAYIYTTLLISLKVGYLHATCKNIRYSFAIVFSAFDRGQAEQVLLGM